MANELAQLMGGENRPKKPSLTQHLSFILHSGKKTKSVDGQFDGFYENLGWTPPVISEDDHRHLVEIAIPQHEEYLRHADQKWINQRVAVMLAHYYVPAMPAQIMINILSDWVRLLSPFPRWAIEDAVNDWLARPEARKPLPGEIAASCRRATEFEALDLRLLRKLAAAFEVSAATPTSRPEAK